MKSTSLRKMNTHNSDFGFENFSEISCESVPAPPACTVATSWPVTKWQLCKEFVCWLEEGQVVLELLEMVEG